jgi:hypothetical protein
VNFDVGAISRAGRPPPSHLQCRKRALPVPKS